MKECSIKDCRNIVYCRSFCSKHYNRIKKWGDPYKVSFVRGDDTARFWSHIVLDGDCWVWNGTQRGKGYGRMQMGRRGISVHRWAYENFIGLIPDGMQIDHLCMNKLCANPAHLEPVTNSENQYRAFKKRGKWPIETREPRVVTCQWCKKEFMSIMYERSKYCSNACRCKAKRAKKKTELIL